MMPKKISSARRLKREGVSYFDMARGFRFVYAGNLRYTNPLERKRFQIFRREK